MKGEHSIVPVVVGRLTVDRSTLTLRRGYGVPVEVPVFIWIIRGPSGTIAVDAGPPDAPTTTARGVPMTQAPDEEPEVALRNAGVDPAEIRMVIVTHLHFDHASNLSLFEGADVVVQRREIEYARAPLPVHAAGYVDPDGLAGVSTGPRWTLVEGDAEVVPGVTVMLTPGHTPGLQSVLVSTRQGPMIIASDNVPLWANWVGEPSGPSRHPGLGYVDLREYYASLARLEDLSAVILPGHDWLALDFARARQ